MHSISLSRNYLFDMSMTRSKWVVTASVVGGIISGLSISGLGATAFFFAFSIPGSIAIAASGGGIILTFVIVGIISFAILSCKKKTHENQHVPPEADIRESFIDTTASQKEKNVQLDILELLTLSDADMACRDVYSKASPSFIERIDKVLQLFDAQFKDFYSASESSSQSQYFFIRKDTSFVFWVSGDDDIQQLYDYDSLSPEDKKLFSAIYFTSAYFLMGHLLKNYPDKILGCRKTSRILNSFYIYIKGIENQQYNTENIKSDLEISRGVTMICPEGKGVLNHNGFQLI